MDAMWIGLVFALVGALVVYMLNKQLATSPSKVLVDGRTHDEWYEIIKAMGKDAVESLARGPLDGVDASVKYGWDYKLLLGSRWNDLEKEWYPKAIQPRYKYDTFSYQKLSRREIIDLQIKFNLIPDGIIGPRTRNVMKMIELEAIS